MLIFIISVLSTFFLNIYPAYSGILADRIAQYPHWEHQFSLPTPNQELIFPSWFEGKWDVNNILLEQIAPLSPKFKTPAFDSNQEYIDKNITFSVQFIPTILIPKNDNFVPTILNKKSVIIPDRAFNGLSIAEAYLGKKNVKEVIINQNNSTEQITKFKGENELISRVIGRQQEIVSEEKFITSEITRQFFRRPNSVYLNLVETITKYRLINPNYIQGKQVTAIYLSPQDPDYFLAFDQPVAFYYYTLDLHRKNP
ncbi:DUF6816 family protein [Geminocystis sp. NIES-3708]|uniref:DUF6816 family protein n=1 Tax=Geminocystis sp. NIES-3708 TaxID=1615909 RepID=UPI0008FFBD6D|nr:hypothetical protein [Geminocystis sp. NIES-3708]